MLPPAERENRTDSVKMSWPLQKKCPRLSSKTQGPFTRRESYSLQMPSGWCFPQVRNTWVVSRFPPCWSDYTGPALQRDLLCSAASREPIQMTGLGASLCTQPFRHRWHPLQNACIFSGTGGYHTETQSNQRGLGYLLATFLTCTTHVRSLSHPSGFTANFHKWGKKNNC